MTSHKTISSLAIAAVALLAIAVPSVAQVQSDQSNRDAQSSVATPAGEQTIAFSTELIAATNSRVATPVKAAVVLPSVSYNFRTPSPVRLSANAFKVQNHFTSVESNRFVSQQMAFNYAGPIDPTARKQFRADDEDLSSGRKLVTFVPSRGQKLPVF